MSTRLYHSWFRQIGQMWAHLRLTQRRNMTYLVVGLYLSKSVLLNQIVLKIPGSTVELSVQRRLRRFLDKSGPAGPALL